MAVNSCLTGSLQEYVPSPSKPWNERRIHHLYNRLSNGAPLSLINSAKSNTPARIIDYLLDTAKSHTLPGDKKGGIGNLKEIDYTYRWKEQNIVETDFNTNYYKYLELVYMWFNGMVTEGVRHKLVLFWSNHFVTGSENYGYYPTWAFQYYWMLHKNALGNFKDFVIDIGRTPAMLHYLDGRLNTVYGPNENYAREVLELFTMGEGHYTQQDVAELARALTGWSVYGYRNNTYYIEPVRYNEFIFYNYYHDWKGKKVLGQTINAVTNTTLQTQATADNEYKRVHDIIFSTRPNQIARRICTKLYQYYMYQDPPQEIIDGLAQVFMQKWDILAVLKTLFKSEHFFEEASMGTMIKSHIENLIHYYRSIGLEPGRDYFKYLFDPPTNTLLPVEPDPLYKNLYSRDGLLGIFYQASGLGQTLFNPINVAGWPGYRSWLNEFALVNRWKHNRDQFSYYLPYNWTKEKYRDFLKELSDNSKDPDFIVRKLIAYFMTVNLSEETINTAVNIFKAPVPANYFIDGSWNLDFELGVVSNQFLNTMNYLVTLPEYQLL